MNNLLNFKSFLKFLGRNKAYTLIDVFGLSVSLMFVLLIAVYTVQEMSTDKFHTKADRIYLVGNENWMATGAAIPYKIKERYPEVERISVWEESRTKICGLPYYSMRISPCIPCR